MTTMIPVMRDAARVAQVQQTLHVSRTAPSPPPPPPPQQLTAEAAPRPPPPPLTAEAAPPRPPRPQRPPGAAWGGEGAAPDLHDFTTLLVEIL